MSDKKPLLPTILFDVRALLVMGAVSLSSVFGGGWVALGQVQEKAKESSKEVVAPVEKRIDAVETEQKNIKGDLKEVQADIRALYKAVMTGEKQKRLEEKDTKDE